MAAGGHSGLASLPPSSDSSPPHEGDSHPPSVSVLFSGLHGGPDIRPGHLRPPFGWLIIQEAQCHGGTGWLDVLPTGSTGWAATVEQAQPQFACSCSAKCKSGAQLLLFAMLGSRPPARLLSMLWPFFIFKLNEPLAWALHWNGVHWCSILELIFRQAPFCTYRCCL